MALFQFVYENERGYKETTFILAPSTLTAVDLFGTTFPEVADYDIVRKPMLVHHAFNSIKNV